MFLVYIAEFTNIVFIGVIYLSLFDNIIDLDEIIYSVHDNFNIEKNYKKINDNKAAKEIKDYLELTQLL